MQTRLEPHDISSSRSHVVDLKRAQYGSELTSVKIAWATPASDLTVSRAEGCASDACEINCAGAFPTGPEALSTGAK